MLELRLRAHTPAPHRIALRLPLGFRIAFALVGLFLLLGVALSGHVTLPSALLVLLCALGAIYDESWVFNGERRVVERKIGVLFLHVRKRYAFDDINSVTVKRYRKFGTAVRGIGDGSGSTGARRNDLVQLSLELVSGENVVIETRKMREPKFEGDLAEMIAKMCGVELIEPEY